MIEAILALGLFQQVGLALLYNKVILVENLLNFGLNHYPHYLVAASVCHYA